MSSAATAKTRVDAWDAALSEEQRWRAYAQMQRAPWYEVSEWVVAEFGIEAPSRSALYRWAARMRAAESAHRLDQAIQARAEIGALAETSATSQRLIAAYQSMAAELALAGNATDAVRLTQMAMAIAAQERTEAELRLKQQRLEQQAEASKLAREKFEATEARLDSAKEVVANTTLTDEERTQKMREIFGL